MNLVNPGRGQGSSRVRVSFIPGTSELEVVINMRVSRRMHGNWQLCCRHAKMDGIVWNFCFGG